ncbi:MAG: hypothetical protein AAGH17_07650 [Pseudomonadota bacterium]
MTERAPPDYEPGEALFEGDLIPNEIADRELSAQPEYELLQDKEVKGARVLVRRGPVERGEDGFVTAMDAEFIPPPGARFTWASLALEITAPKGCLFDDIAPKEITDNRPVKFSVKWAGSIGIKTEAVDAVDASGEKTAEFTQYHNRVTGYGKGSHAASWTFAENAAVRDGVSRFNRLTFAIRSTDPVTLRVTTAVQVIKPGLPGMAARARELMLGPKLNEIAVTRFAVEAGEEPENKGFFGRWI